MMFYTSEFLYVRFPCLNNSAERIFGSFGRHHFGISFRTTLCVPTGLSDGYELKLQSFSLRLFKCQSKNAIFKKA